MPVRTRHPTKRSSIAQGTAIIGRNGLPVDTVASFDSSIPILEDVNTAITFSSPTVTVDNSIDLNLLVNREFKNTQLLSFTDAENVRYFIDRTSINDSTKTFDIYEDLDLSIPATVVSLATGWTVHELKWVNRLATSTSTVVENVEFAGVDMTLSLDGKSGDSVRIVDEEGDELDITDQGSVKTREDIFDSTIVLETGTSLASAFNTSSVDVENYSRGLLKASWAGANADNDATFVVEVSNDDIDWVQLGESGTTLLNETDIQIWQFLEFPAKYFRLVHTENSNNAGTVDVEFTGRF